jgi:hypothetical protein
LAIRQAREAPARDHLKEGSVDTTTLLIIIVILLWLVAAVGTAADAGINLGMGSGALQAGHGRHGHV